MFDLEFLKQNKLAVVLILVIMSNLGLNVTDILSPTAQQPIYQDKDYKEYLEDYVDDQIRHEREIFELKLQRLIDEINELKNKA